MSAAITPGTQPQRVKSTTMTIEPHPLSITAKGGNNIDSNTRQKPIVAKLRLLSYELIALTINARQFIFRIDISASSAPLRLIFH